jgi:hypothetical protein
MSSQPSHALEHGAVPWLLAGALATAAPARRAPAAVAVAAGRQRLLWRAWLWQRRRPLPPRWSLALLVMAGVAGIAWQFHSLFGKDPASPCWSCSWRSNRWKRTTGVTPW